MNAPTPDALFAAYLSSGDAERFAELHDLLRDELLRAAERLAPNRSAAEDLVQATFLGALESAGRFERNRKVVPWLYGILQNQARMMRWRQRRTPDPQRVHWPEPADPADLAADREFDAALAGAFARLGPTYAPVMQMHLGAGMSAQDIGKALERPAGTVRTQVVRGTAMLRSLLPAGLASLLLVRVSPGLDAVGVRRLLADHAVRGGVPVTTAWPTRSLALASAGLLAVAASWLAFGSLAGNGPAPEPGPAVPAGADARTTAAARSTPTSPATGPAAERLPVDAPATTGLTVIVTHEGAPVAAVPVQVTALADWRFHRHLRLTDAAGRAHFTHLPAGAVLVQPQAERSARADASVELEPGRHAEHHVALERVLTCTGRVVDAQGAPLAGAQVWLCDGDFQYSFGFGAQRTMVTDADGRFTVAATARTQFTHVQVTAPGFRASPLRALPRQDAEPLTIVLAPGGDAVRGTVVDRTGAPLAGVLVRAVHAGERSRLAAVGADGTTTGTDGLGAVREVRSDRDGRFVIDGFARGHLVALRVWEAAFARHDTTLPAGAPPVTVTLEPGATIRGRVVDAAGNPVVDAEVGTEADGDDPVVSRVRTEQDGSYTLTAVTPGDAVPVTAVSLPDPVDGRGGAGNASAQLRLAAGTTTTWNPVLAAGTAFRGTLRREDGTPLEGWRHDLVAIDEVAGRNHFPVRVDARGAFEVRNVTPARYWLRFERDNCIPMQFVVTWPLAERYDIVVPARVERRAIDWCRSVRAPQPASVGTVAIEGEATQPIAFYVFAVDDAASWRWISSGVQRDHDGARWVAHLEPGRYELVAFSTQWSRDALATGDQTIPFTIKAGQTTVLRPELAAGVRRCFRIEEPSSHLVANSAVAEVRDAAGTLVSRWIVPRWLEPAPGTFEASVALAPGRYRIEVDTELGHRGALDFTVDGLVPCPDVQALPVR